MIAALLFLAVMGVTGAATRLVLRHALRVSLLDVPTHRSSHSEPTPRGGGLPVAVLWVVGVPAAAAADVLDWRPALALACGGALIAAVGWIDDHGDLAYWVRLTSHLLAAVWTVAALGGITETVIGPFTLHLGLTGSALAVLGLVWMTNLYNFMDGIDGIAGVEALTVGLAVAALLAAGGAGRLALIPLLLAAAAAGFLFWNWPPARIFMGDVGSGLLGFAFGAIALAGDRLHGVPLAVTLLPLGVFILDATITLVARLARGERVYEAHRSHLYQRLLQAGWSARRICAAVALLNLVLALAALVGVARPALFIPAAVGASVVVVAAGIVMLRVARRAGHGHQP